ncbi:MAG: methionyl-tRNA formyltransferase [Chlorobi bacterium]|nr:methionyl-tRNA formyltransferase [Chlorobiota bacterium]
MDSEHTTTIVFFANGPFAIPSLELLSKHFNTVVVTNPPKPAGRGKRLTPTVIEQKAKELGLPIIHAPKSLKDPEFIKKIKELNSPLGVVVAFRILPEEIISIFPYGIINLHPSLLPAYRGPAPIQWAIINGEEKTGITTILISKDVDAGPILMQKEEPIYPEDTTGILSERLSVKGSHLLLESINKWLRKEIVPKPQEGTPTPAPKLNKENTRINWDEPADLILRKIRAFNPVPYAWTVETHSNKRFKIVEAGLSSADVNLQPGKAITTKKEIIVGTGTRPIILKKLIPEGKKTMEAPQFLAGWQNKPLNFA